MHRLKPQFKLIVLNAVWMHVNPRDRETAFRNLVGLGAADALIVVSIRHGCQEPGRGMYPAPGSELEDLALPHRARIIRSTEADDQRGRPDIHWTQLALRTSDQKADRDDRDNNNNRTQ